MELGKFNEGFLLRFSEDLGLICWSGNGREKTVNEAVDALADLEF